MYDFLVRKKYYPLPALPVTRVSATGIRKLLPFRQNTDEPFRPDNVQGCTFSQKLNLN